MFFELGITQNYHMELYISTAGYTFFDKYDKHVKEETHGRLREDIQLEHALFDVS